MSNEAKLDQILEKLTAAEARFDSLQGEVRGLQGEVERLGAKQEETVVAFRSHYSDMAGLYRQLREDLGRFEVRVEAKLSQVNQSIQALKDSLDRQDFRADEHARRISRLEEQPREPL